MVAGGLELMSYTTRFTPFTLLMISLEIFIRKSSTASVPNQQSSRLSIPPHEAPLLFHKYARLPLLRHCLPVVKWLRPAILCRTNRVLLIR